MARRLAGPGTLLPCGFRVALDTGRATRTVEVRSLSEAGERRLRLTVDEEGLVVEYTGFATRVAP